jgi:hypothetical protein
VAAGPVDDAVDAPDQKDRFLPAICTGTENWCQLFSGRTR